MKDSEKMECDAIPSPSRRLVQYYQQRMERNPAYSRRALARQIGIGPGALSEILAGKRPLTIRMGMRMVERLKLPEEEAREFLAEITQSELQRNAEIQAGQLGKYDRDFRELDAHSEDEDTFRVLSEWPHFAILSLMETSDFKFRYPWIAARLGISIEQSREAVARLKRVGLVKYEGKRLVLGQSRCASTTQVYSRALRECYRQSLHQSLKAIDGAPVAASDFSTITLAIDPDKVPLAKTLFRHFRRFAAHLLETGDRREVYALNIQFIPLTQRGSDEKQ